MTYASDANRTVILLSHGFQSEYEAGIANGLARNGLKVVLVGSDATLYGRLDPDVEAINLRGSHDPKRARWRKAWNLLRYFAAYQWLLLTRKHAAVHLIGQFTTANPLVSLFEAILTRLWSRRLVLTVHNVMPHEKHTPFNRLIHKLLYAVPNALVVHTARTRQRLHDLFGIAPEQVRVVEHGIARFPQFDVEARRSIRSRLGVAEHEQLALFFGNLGLYKGPDLLLDAFARLPVATNWSLLITGRCRHADLRVQIQGLIDSHPLRPRIHWEEGFVADEEVPAIFFAADLLVLPYRHIDQSGVLFMAMATGLPVLATDVGSFRDYVRAHAGSTVPAEDVEALRAAMESFQPLDEPARRGLAEAARRFDWTATSRTLLDVYGVAAA